MKTEPKKRLETAFKNAKILCDAMSVKFAFEVYFMIKLTEEELNQSQIVAKLMEEHEGSKSHVQSCVSFALKAFKAVNIISARRQGKYYYYKIVNDEIFGFIYEYFKDMKYERKSSFLTKQIK